MTRYRCDSGDGFEGPIPKGEFPPSTVYGGVGTAGVNLIVWPSSELEGTESAGKETPTVTGLRQTDR